MPDPAQPPDQTDKDPGPQAPAQRSPAQQAQVRITLTPYASALPLASFAFGTGNVLYAAFLFGWIPASESLLLALMLLAFVAPLELLPSVMAFLSRDAGGATAFAIFGASWIVQGLQLLVFGPPTHASPATGLFLACLALALAILAGITFPGKPLLGGLLVVAVARTTTAAITDVKPSLGASAHLTHVTGSLGLVLAALAFYAAVAFLEEDVTGRLSPRTCRPGAAKAAMEGKLEDQLSQLTREAGVRKQL